MEKLKMFNIIHHNKAKTVGLASDPHQLKHIGAFSPKYLKEWLKMIDEVFGDDVEDVQVFVKKSVECECFALCASHDGESPFVVVCGRYRTDGRKWEDLI